VVLEPGRLHALIVVRTIRNWHRLVSVTFDWSELKNLTSARHT
jgi:hypothetical protein